MKLALEEHQAALDLIMLRYRQQVLQMVQMNWVQKLAEKSVDASRVSLNFSCGKWCGYFYFPTNRSGGHRAPKRRAGRIKPNIQQCQDFFQKIGLEPKGWGSEEYLRSDLGYLS